jgi:hypothetical protein
MQRFVARWWSAQVKEVAMDASADAEFSEFMHGR